MQCISFLGQFKKMMQGQSWGGTNLNDYWSLYVRIIVMAHNCSWKVSFLRSLFLSTSDWLLRYTNEGTAINAITTLSEAFGVEGFAISITWSWILKQLREFNKGSAIAVLVDNGWHQILETGVRGKSYMPTWITDTTELLTRIALGVNGPLPIWRSRRTDIPSCPCWQI